MSNTSRVAHIRFLTNSSSTGLWMSKQLNCGRAVYRRLAYEVVPKQDERIRAWVEDASPRRWVKDALQDREEERDSMGTAEEMAIKLGDWSNTGLEGDGYILNGPKLLRRMVKVTLMGQGNGLKSQHWAKENWLKFLEFHFKDNKRHYSRAFDCLLCARHTGQPSVYRDISQWSANPHHLHLTGEEELSPAPELHNYIMHQGHMP